MKPVALFFLSLLTLVLSTAAQAQNAFTACESLTKPPYIGQSGNLGTFNNWGPILNTNLDLMDTALAGNLSFSITPGSTSIVLQSFQGAPDQSRYAHYKFTGALTANVTIFWPISLCRSFSVTNSTSGAYTFTVAVNNGFGTPYGAVAIIPSGATETLLSDGQNVLVAGLGGPPLHVTNTQNAYSWQSWHTNNPIGLFSADNENGLVGAASNDATPGTAIFPTGITGYGIVMPGATGNTAFGLYGEADLADHGSAVGAELDCFNYKGTPDTNLPPNQSIGTASNSCVGLQVGAGGQYNGSVGIHIGGALGGVYSTGTAQLWSTGLYIGSAVASGGATQYGLFIDAGSNGPGTSALIQNYGAGINLQLGTNGTYVANNAVITVVDHSSVSHFSVRQSGDIYTTGLLEFSQVLRPAVTNCGTSPGVNNSNDQDGIISTGTGTVTSCTVTFSRSFHNIPSVTLSGEATGAVVLSVSTKSISGFTVAFSGNVAGFNFDYHASDQN